MKCKHCDGKGEMLGWIPEPCAYCGGTGKSPDDFSEIIKLKRCKKCGGEAVFSGVFDDPVTYRFPECIKCGARAEGNNTKDSWYERARKWNEQNTQTNEEWFDRLSTEEKVKALLDLREKIRQKMREEIGSENKFHKGDYYREWLKEKHE